VAVEKAERRGIKEAVELKKPKGRAIGCNDDRANSMRRGLSAPGKIHSDGGDLEFPPPPFGEKPAGFLVYFSGTLVVCDNFLIRMASAPF